MIVVNNKSYIGKSVTISGSKVIVDGVDVTPDSKEISISIQGDIDNLTVDYCKEIKIEGNVNTINNGSGDITCSTVFNGVKSGSGDVESDTIEGDVTTGSGDVKCETITGSVRTGSGNIKYKK